jgi:HEAT repeat protein
MVEWVSRTPRAFWFWTGLYGQFLHWANSEYNHAECAVYGFRALGPEAEPAIPDLGRLLSHSNVFICVRAKRALVSIGAASIPEFEATIKDQRSPSRPLAAAGLAGLSRYGTNASAAVPILLQCLGDRDMFVIVNAAEGLGMFGMEPDVCIPALVGRLNDTNAFIRSNLAKALGAFGTNAQGAAVHLVPLLCDSKAYVRAAATNALEKIAPEVLKNAARK